jgi:hypothetical protein
MRCCLLFLFALSSLMLQGQCPAEVVHFGSGGAVGSTAFLAGQSITAPATGAVLGIEMTVCQTLDAQLAVRLPAAAGEPWNSGQLLATSPIVAAANENASYCFPSSYGMSYYEPTVFAFADLGFQSGQTYVLELLSGIAASAAESTYSGGTAFTVGGPSASTDAAFEISLCPDATATFGCTDPEAAPCNYDAAADYEDGSCTYADCAGTCGGTGYDDPTCGCVPSEADAGSCLGCTDATACNYDSEATFDDGSCFDDPCQCTYGAEAETTDCGCVGGTTGISADACIAGCLTDVIANDGPPGNSTYRLGQTFTATTTGLLHQVDLRTCSGSDAQLILRQAPEAGEAWNSGLPLDTSNFISASASSLGFCAISSYGTTYHPWSSFTFSAPEGTPIGAGETYVLELRYGLALTTASADYAGGTSISGTGTPEPTKDLAFRVYTCEQLDLVFGCTDAAACNFAGASAEDGSCLYEDCNGDCGGTATTTDCGCTGGNTGLEPGHCLGCTDPTACNYGGSWATIDDGSCAMEDCNGDCAGTAVLDPDCGCIGGNTGFAEEQCHAGCLTELLEHEAAGSLAGFMTGQSFTAPHNGYLTRIDLRVCTSSDATVNIHSASELTWNGGELLGTSNTVAGTSGSSSVCLTSSYGGTNYVWRSFTFDSIPMNPGTSYVIELTEGIALAGINDYDGGVAIGSTGPSDGRDLAFRLFTCQAELIWGCTDPTKCNYNVEATHNDGSCEVDDCNGDCGGTASTTACGCVGGNTGSLAIQCIGSCLTDIVASAATAPDATAAYATQTFTPDADGFLTGLEIIGCAAATYSVTLRRNSIDGLLLGTSEFSAPTAMDLPTDACDRDAHGGAHYTSRLLQLDSIPLEAGRMVSFELNGGLALANSENNHLGGTAFSASGLGLIGRDLYFRSLACAPQPGELVWGCTDAAACNFAATATHDDGSCLTNDCNGDCGGTAFEDTNCGCVGGNTGLEAAWCEGCLDPAACNYSPSVTFDDGSCAEEDCNGDCGGTATEDDFCGCMGGATGINPANCLDMCLGDVALTSYTDPDFVSNGLVISGGGQTFTAPTTARLTGIRVRASNVTGSLSLDVLGLSAPNVLTGATVLAELSSEDWSEDLDSPGTGGSIFFPLADPILLTAGEPYAFRLEGTGWLALRSSADDLFAGGASFGGGASTASARDLFFEIITCTDLAGCMDNTACNYEDWANIPDASRCLYLDCNNECGGTAVYSDACELCIGGSTGYDAEGCIGGCATIATSNLSDTVPLASGRNGQRLKVIEEGYIMRVDLNVCAFGNSRLQWRAPDSLSAGGWGSTWDEGRIWGLSEIVEGPSAGASDCDPEDEDQWIWQGYDFDSIPVEPNELVALVLQGRASARTTENNYGFGSIVDNQGVQVNQDLMFKIYTCPATITIGCTDPLACNFNEFAEKDDGSCIEPGCDDPTAYNYNPAVACSNNAFCHYCDEAIDFQQVDRKYSGYGVSCHNSEDGIIEVRPESPRDRVERVELYGLTDGIAGDRQAVNYIQIHHDPRTTFKNLSPGDYRIIAWDAGCPDTLDHTVTAPDSLVWEGIQRVNFGVGERDFGSVKFVWSGGVATTENRPSAVIFDRLDRPSFIDLNASDAIWLTSGIYRLGFRDGNGCPAVVTTPSLSLGEIDSRIESGIDKFYEIRTLKSDYIR